MIDSLSRKARRLWLRLRRRCPECAMGRQVHKLTCSRRSGPGRRLWAQDG